MLENLNQDLKNDFEAAKDDVVKNYNIVRDEGWLKKVVNYVEHLEELIGLRKPAAPDGNAAAEVNPVPSTSTDASTGDTTQTDAKAKKK